MSSKLALALRKKFKGNPVLAVRALLGCDEKTARQILADERLRLAQDSARPRARDTGETVRHGSEALSRHPSVEEAEQVFGDQITGAVMERVAAFLRSRGLDSEAVTQAVRMIADAAAQSEPPMMQRADAEGTLRRVEREPAAIDDAVAAIEKMLRGKGMADGDVAEALDLLPNNGLSGIGGKFSERQLAGDAAFQHLAEIAATAQPSEHASRLAADRRPGPAPSEWSERLAFELFPDLARLTS